MAAAGALFSIRGYAVLARAEAAEEGSRCWPFSGEAGALPPMEVRRFRWWADEAALAAAEEKREGEEERRMAAKRRKRSIVELFATVPRVAGGEGLGRGKRVRRKVEKGELVVGVNSKKEELKKKVSIGIGARKKEKSRKVKVTSLSISQLFQDAIQKRKLKCSLGKKKRNQEVSVLLNKKSMKGNKKSVLDNQKDIKKSCQVQSILKKHLKTGLGAFLKNTDLRCPSKSSRKSKHVSFCDDDDIFGSTASQPEDDMERSQLLQTSQQPSQDGKSQVDDDQRNTLEPQFVYQRVDPISGTVVENTSSSSEKVVSGVCRSVPLTRSKERTILGNSLDLNHFIDMPNRGNCLNSIGSAALSGQVLAKNFSNVDLHLKEGLYLDVGRQAEVNRRMIQQGSNVPVSLAAETRSDVIRSPLSQPSHSRFVTSLKEACDGKRSILLQERFVANCHLTEVHPRPLRYGKDMVSSVSSSTGSNKPTDAQTTDCVSAYRNVYFSNGYVGLPLNSHGEFIKVQPGGTLNPNEVFKRQCLGEDSLHPSALPAVLTPKTCMDYANLRIKHQSLPYFTPTMPTAYGMDVRQFSSSERMEGHNYAIPNKYPCSNQQEFSVECFCSGCMGQNNQPQKIHEMQSCFPRQNYEQNIQPAAETTVRLMGKTVSLGTSSKQCRGLHNKSPCSSTQIRAQDHYFEGTCTKAFPQLFHGGLVDSPSTFRISNGGGQPYEYPSCFSSFPAAELRPGLDTNSFRTNSHSQQPQLAVPNKLFVKPVSRYNEAELGYQGQAVANQVSTAKHVQVGSMHSRHTQSVATMSSYDPNNSFKNFVATTSGPSQFSYFPKKFSNITQRAPISSFLSGYAVQNTSGLTTQTKFTSLSPLPPSMISSHVYSSEDAQPHGSTPAFYPSIPLSDPTRKCNAPGDAIFKDKRSMKQTTTGTNLESAEQINRSCKRSAEKDYVLLTLPKKPCIAVGKDLNLSPLPEEGLEFCGSTPDGQQQDIPVCLSKEPEVDLRLVNNDTRTTWSDSVNSGGTRPVKLRCEAKHILQPSTNASNSMDEEDSWPVHSIIPFALNNDACTVSTSMKTDAEIYRF